MQEIHPWLPGHFLWMCNHLISQKQYLNEMKVRIDPATKMNDQALFEIGLSESLLWVRPPTVVKRMNHRRTADMLPVAGLSSFGATLIFLILV
jgi:hypothetical protein